MVCSTTGYTGQNYCDKNSRFGKPTGIAFAIDGHSNTAADFLLEASWQDDIQAQQVFPLMEMVSFEDQSTEPTYQEYDSGKRRLMEQGDYRFTAMFDVNECTKKQLLNFRGFQEGIYLIYGDVIRGRSIDAGTTVKPIRIEQCNIMKESLPTMSETGRVGVVIDLKSDKDLNEYDYSREMSWDVDELDGLTEVSLSIVTATASEIVVDVSADCGGNSKQISGLGTEITDWSVGSGTISGVTESATVRGRYTIAGATMAGDVDLASPVDRSDTVMVISSGAVASGI
jgi:hypothetical protein